MTCFQVSLFRAAYTSVLTCKFLLLKTKSQAFNKPCIRLPCFDSFSRMSHNFWFNSEYNATDSNAFCFALTKLNVVLGRSKERSPFRKIALVTLASYTRTERFQPSWKIPPQLETASWLIISFVKSTDNVLLEWRSDRNSIAKIKTAPLIVLSLICYTFSFKKNLCYCFGAKNSHVLYSLTVCINIHYVNVN